MPLLDVSLRWHDSFFDLCNNAFVKGAAERSEAGDFINI
jgi:hypothetical protein